jgi:DNA-binding NarL/FixJ family response regulator
MIKLILADNQAIFRAGIAKVLAVEEDIRIVSQAQSRDQMMIALEKLRANVLVCSSHFTTDLRGVVETARRFGTYVLMVGEAGEDTGKLLAQGALGVVFRSVTSENLLACVRKVAHGETCTESPEAAKEIQENDLVGARVRDRLTPKELKIVALIVQGYKNKEIASQLGTTEQVIKNYLRNVYDKIGVSDRLELALFTIHHRILAEAAAATTAQIQATPQ